MARLLRGNRDNSIVAMKTPPPQNYPDIADILARKAEGRKNAARKTFAEKLDWLEKAREDLKPFARLREEWRAQRAKANKTGA